MTKLRPQTLQEAVLRELRRRINDGELPPGTVIRVDAIAEILGVSRIPVREALMILEGEGLVTHRPHVGFAVPSLTAEELEEIYWLRALLEDEALRLAVSAATDADHARARETCAAAEQALAEGQVLAFSQHGRCFHAAVLGACRKPRLLRLLDGLWDACETYRAANTLNEFERATLQEEHRLMLDAFLTGDEHHLIKSAQVHREHLLRGALLAATAGLLDEGAPTATAPGSRREAR